MRLPTALSLSVLLAVSLPLAAQDAGGTGNNLRVYRCVGSNGAVSLQDAPCRDGRQEVRDMQRPRDPAPRVVRSDVDPTATPNAPPQREVRHVYVQPPQPLFECVRDDGTRYTSDNGDGNPRWVPVWTSVYLPYGRGHRPPGGGGGGGHYPTPQPLPPIAPMGAGSITSSGGGLAVSGGGRRGGASVSIGSSSTQWEGSRQAYPGTYTDTVVPAGNVMVRDQCSVLPQQEVCARLQDRRWELVRQYNSALQGERDALNREQRSVDARLQRDCR
jgi:hypothetical protein